MASIHQGYTAGMTIYRCFMNANVHHYHKFLASQDETLELGALIAGQVKPGSIIFLYGELGAGKTTFARGFLRGLGYHEKVKSPTYTLIETYTINETLVFHFDFYRLADARELEQIGINEYFTAGAICLIEWPDKAFPFLPAPDLICSLSIKDEGREITLEALSENGKKIVNYLIL
jgi:tRNA threonylcarbamoyladenosine biosynthesis protein TsaE